MRATPSKEGLIPKLLKGRFTGNWLTAARNTNKLGIRLVSFWVFVAQTVLSKSVFFLIEMFRIPYLFIYLPSNPSPTLVHASRLVGANTPRSHPQRSGMQPALPNNAMLPTNCCSATNCCSIYRTWEAYTTDTPYKISICI